MGFFSFLSADPNKSGKTVSRKYTLAPLTFTIEAEIVKGLETEAYLEKYTKPATGFEQPRQRLPIDTFFADVDNMVNFMSTKNILDGESAFSTLDSSCRSHIIKYGRLFERDLRGYVLILMKIVNAIAVSRGMKRIKEEDDIDTKIALTNYILNKYPNHIAY